MSDHLTPHEQRYSQALYRYTSALERGDIETVAAILHEAELDHRLEQAILAANAAYQDEQNIALHTEEIESAHAIVLSAFSAHDLVSAHEIKERPFFDEQLIQPQRGRKYQMLHHTTPAQEEEKVSTLSAKHPRLRRFSAFAQSLVAVLVVGLILSGFGLLFASRHHTTTGSGTTPTTLSHEIVVASTIDGTIYATRPDTGAVAWHYATGKPVVGGFSELTVQGDVVYFASGGQLYAIRATTGQLLWHKNLDYPKADQTSYSKIIVDRDIVFIGGDVFGVGAPGGSMYALRARDGAILWQHSSVSSPLLAVHNGVAYVKTTLNEKDDIAVQALHGSDGSLLWSYTTPVMSVVADNTAVYVYSAHPINVPGETPPTSKKQNKTLLALNPKGELLWSNPVVSDDASPIALAQSVVVLGNMGHDVNTRDLCAYRKNDGLQVWCVQNEDWNSGVNRASYTAANDAVYSRYQDPAKSGMIKVEARNAADGSLRWSSDVVGQLDMGTIAVMNQTMYVYTANGILHWSITPVEHGTKVSANMTAFVIVRNRVYAISDGGIHWQLLNKDHNFTSIAVGSW